MAEQDRLKWNARYESAGASAAPPSQVLVSLKRWLPGAGRVLDLAGGNGRNALWLAQQGLQPTVADISDAGLRQAARHARTLGVPLHTLQIDLERQGPPPGPWDLIVSVLYLWRPLLRQLPDLLAPGGTLIVIQPTVRNLERHARPPRDYLLQERELPQLIALPEVLEYREGWLEDGRHDAVLVARSAHYDHVREPDKPEPDKPEPDKPEPDKPEPGKPEAGERGPDTPG